MRDTLIKNLREGKVQLVGKDGKQTELSVKDLGISYPAIVSELGRPKPQEIIDPNSDDKAAKPGEGSEPKKIVLQRFDFVLQFAWQPTPLSKRLEIEQQRAKQQTPALAADGQQAAGQ